MIKISPCVRFLLVTSALGGLGAVVGPSCNSNNGGPASSSGGTTGSGGTSSSGGATGSGGTSSSGGTIGSGGTSSGGSEGPGGSNGGGGHAGAADSGGNGGAVSGSGGRGGGAGTGQTGSGGDVDGGTADALDVHDGAVSGGGGAGAGAYVRTGWTASYTCRTPTTATSACLRNGNTPGDLPSYALDGKYATRWSTDAYEQELLKRTPTSDMPVYFTLDMKQVMNISKIVMHPGCMDPIDVPGTMEVYLSADGTFPSTPIVADHHPPYMGSTCPANDQEAPPPATFDTMAFATTPARYIQVKMTQTLQQAHGSATHDRFWAIGEMYVFP